MTGTGSLRLRADGHGLVVEDGDGAECLRLDAGGRWTAWERRGVLARRDLSGGVSLRRRGAPTPLGEADADRVEALVREAAERLLGKTRHPLLRLAAARTPEAARADRARFRATWPDGIPILPPHRYRDVVVDPARGCPNGTCSFCRFWRDRPFRPLDAAAFAAHLEAVSTHVGDDAVAARGGVFLGSASAASLPDTLLLDRLSRVVCALGRPRRGVAAFLDPDHAPRRDAVAWAHLVAAGLADVTVGLETGLPDLRAAVGKSADLARFAGVVRAARDGGARVAVCVLLGLGGTARCDAHREATVRALGDLALSARDLVYLSPLLPTTEGSLSRDVLAAEAARWRAALARATPARVAEYGPDRFVPWA